MEACCSFKIKSDFSQFMKSPDKDILFLFHSPDMYQVFSKGSALGCLYLSAPRSTAPLGGYTSDLSFIMGHVGQLSQRFQNIKRFQNIVMSPFLSHQSWNQSCTSDLKKKYSMKRRQRNISVILFINLLLLRLKFIYTLHFVQIGFMLLWCFQTEGGVRKKKSHMMVGSMRKESWN